MQFLPYILYALGIVLAAAAGYLLRRMIGEAKIKSAETEAKRILEQSTKAAETKHREILLEARDSAQKSGMKLTKKYAKGGRKYNALSGG